MAAKKTAKKPAKRAAKGAKNESGLSKKLALKALAGHTANIKRLQKNIERNAWHIGAQLERIATLGLHTACGYASIEAYADKELQIAGTTAFQYMRVAKAFTAEMVGTYGVQKCDWAIAHVARTPEEDMPRDVLSETFEVEGDDGRTHRKAFKEMRLSELRRVAQTERDSLSSTRKKKRDAGLPTAIREKLANAGRALDKAVGPKAAPTANVAWRETADDTVIDATGVPLQHARKALRALSDALA